MGTLIAKKYPTKLFAKAADHTYVECGAGGKAWSCWGGKVGGTAFNLGVGSTARADAIAEPNERAAIRCYLVNGVCHQAANRILYPAGILVSSARGYTLSVSVFGTYGRAGVGACATPIPFNSHAGATGDLAQCVSRTSSPVRRSATAVREAAHARAMWGLYSSFGATGTATALDEMNLQVRMFGAELDFRFNGKLASSRVRNLMQAKSGLELTYYVLADELRRNLLEPARFILEFNAMTDKFQDDAANTLTERQFKQMFGYGRDERLSLPDPDALDVSFGQGTGRRVYPQLPP